MAWWNPTNHVIGLEAEGNDAIKMNKKKVIQMILNAFVVKFISLSFSLSLGFVSVKIVDDSF